MITEVNPFLLKLSSGENLTIKEARKAFNIVGDEDEESYFFTALTIGLMAKGPTPEEMYGFCLDRKDRIGTLKVKIGPEKLIDFAGGGGDKIKTLNVSTAASFVAAAGGIYVAKQAAAAFTGYTGSSDVLNELGVGVATRKRDVKKLKQGLEKIGIAAYNYACFAPEKFKNFFKWRKKIVESGMKYYVPYHIASFAYSPIKMKNRIYGLASDKYMRLLAQLLQKLGFKRAMVLHGVDGLDEMSNIGKTRILEIKGKKINEYEAFPKDLGVKKVKAKDITTTSKEENIKDFVRILYGKEKGPKRDLVAVNAGTAFYLTGKTKNLKSGTKLAITLLEEKKSAEKLEMLVEELGDRRKLESWKKKAGI